MDAVDALGTPVATFNRAKSAEISAENALFDLNLMATQMGVSKQIADASHKITVPAFETITVDGSATYTLSHSPKTAPNAIYKLNGDSTLGTKYTKAVAASATEFVISSTTLTPPTGLSNGDELYVMYEYESEEACAVTNTAINFPVGCKLVFEVLGCDVCDQSTQVYAYIVFPNFKMSSDFDWSVATENGTSGVCIVICTGHKLNCR